MMRSSIDWPYMRRHTLRPAASFVVAASLLLIASLMHSVAQRNFTNLTVNQFAMHEDYDALVSQRRIINRYHRRYKLYGDIGFIGHENRVDWVEALRLTALALDMPAINYAIEPQREVVPPVLSAQGGENLQIRVSQSQLELNVLHEVELLRFFDELQRQVPGLIKVDECTLTHVGGSDDIENETNLTAHCTVQTYSVVTSDADWGTTE